MSKVYLWKIFKITKMGKLAAQSTMKILVHHELVVQETLLEFRRRVNLGLEQSLLTG